MLVLPFDSNNSFSIPPPDVRKVDGNIIRLLLLPDNANNSSCYPLEIKANKPKLLWDLDMQPNALNTEKESG